MYRHLCETRDSPSSNWGGGKESLGRCITNSRIHFDSPGENGAQGLPRRRLATWRLPLRGQSQVLLRPCCSYERGYGCWRRGEIVSTTVWGVGFGEVLGWGRFGSGNCSGFGGFARFHIDFQFLGVWGRGLRVLGLRVWGLVHQLVEAKSKRQLLAVHAQPRRFPP